MIRTIIGTTLAVALSMSAPLPAQSTDRAYDLQSGGLARHYLLHLPPGATAAPRPLVVLLHGRLGTGAGLERMAFFDRVADSAGVVVAYPDGWRRSWDDGRPGTPAARRHVDDVAFLLALLDDVARRTAIDPGRVYLAGMSNGGFMTERMACEAPGRFAAVGVVVATLSDSLAGACRLGTPVPALFIHGTDDPLVPFNGGRLGDRGNAVSADSTVALWAAWDRCGPSAPALALADTAHDGTTVEVRRYADCAGGAEVVGYVVRGGGHAWPGGTQYLPVRFVGRASRNLDASLELWRFFARHRR